MKNPCFACFFSPEATKLVHLLPAEIINLTKLVTSYKCKITKYKTKQVSKLALYFLQNKVK